jgi:hypothetical protein
MARRLSFLIEKDMHFRCRKTGTLDLFGIDRIARKVQFGKLGAQGLYTDARVHERAQDHVAGYTGNSRSKRVSFSPNVNTQLLLSRHCERSEAISF